MLYEVNPATRDQSTIYDPPHVPFSLVLLFALELFLTF